MAQVLGTGGPLYEGQIQSAPDGGYQLVVTISVARDTWTTPPVQLVAKTMDAARAESVDRVRALIHVLAGEEE